MPSSQRPALAKSDNAKSVTLTEKDLKDATRLLIFFDYDRADLKRESVPELRRAVEWLKENPDIRVEIGGAYRFGRIR